MSPHGEAFGRELIERDRRVLWHPFTQHGLEPEPLSIVGASGAELELADGRIVIDAISSWWATLHGHGEPRIAAAIAAQATQLDHVLFAGATHEPAVRLAEELVARSPDGLDRVFFSDDGSTSVEVALKIAIQSHVQRGEPQRRVFVALVGGYHGDTFGAMSVGDPDPFFLAFAPLLFEVRRVPPDAVRLEEVLDELGDTVAGVIVEPLLQGAAGMRVHGPDFLRAARSLTRIRGLPLIADEVMTGFGRTGALFACERAGIAPDLMCVAKGLTGGTLPLSATLATSELFDVFLSSDRARAFFHGHTFTASPIGCAAALASLELLDERRTPERLEKLGRRIHGALVDLESDRRVSELRRLGGMVAFDLVLNDDSSNGYLAGRSLDLRRIALDHGVLLRPLGPVVYALPPACTTDDEADRIAAAMRALVEAT